MEVFFFILWLFWVIRNGKSIKVIFVFLIFVDWFLLLIEEKFDNDWICFVLFILFGILYIFVFLCLYLVIDVVEIFIMLSLCNLNCLFNKFLLDVNDMKSDFMCVLRFDKLFFLIIIFVFLLL